MKIYKIIVFNVLLLSAINLSARDYKASLFGVKSDGVTLNTGSIQYAIDYISENGGGQLVFYVGRYLTGSVKLKSNVTIELKEGAVLVGASSIYNYLGLDGTNALITAYGEHNIGVVGKGIIEGQGAALRNSIEMQLQKEYLKGSIVQNSPLLVYFNKCRDVTVDGIIMKNACGNIQLYSSCENLTVTGLTLINKAVAESKGIVLDTCDGVNISGLYFETSGTELFKKGTSKNVSVAECINSQGRKIK